ncbi:hypothetical protein AB0K09_29205, partial [Streptomyces sp. NPDC049577]
MTTSLRNDGAPAPAGIPEPHADPVRGLLHRHRALCAGAVDALEIAAGLEARGVTDRTAADYRHRDVFSLAEELHARVEHEQGGAGRTPRGAETGSGPAPSRGRCPARRAAWGLLGTLAWLWLLGYGLFGERLLAALLHGRRGGGARALLAAAAPTALALACALVPAAWCAHWFAARVRRALADSRSLA